MNPREQLIQELRAIRDDLHKVVEDWQVITTKLEELLELNTQLPKTEDEKEV